MVSNTPHNDGPDDEPFDINDIPSVDAVRIAQQKAAIAAATRTPTGAALSTLFNRNSGKIILDDGNLTLSRSANGLYRSTDPHIIAHFFRKPKVVLSPFANDSTVIHEWRHHHQDTLIHIGQRRGLRDAALLSTWIEADARAAEVLHLIEKMEAAKILRATDPDHADHELSDLRYAAYEYSFGPDKKLFLTIGQFAHSDEAALSRDTKMQLMRTAFDNYMSESRRITNFYRAEQLRRVNKTKPVPIMVGYALGIAGVMNLVGAQSWMDLQAAMNLSMAASFFYLRAKFANIHLHDSPRPVNAALLERLGTMPHGPGNYLTDIKGKKLDHKLYQSLPVALEQAITAKQAEMKYAAIPLGVTAHKIKDYIAAKLS
ncbi:MAG: hypothetical protein KJ667_09110 [Alphaproteobacteria bacterium]|nr:hypothetical protein [Alphaproteobacteria bacterium]